MSEIKNQNRSASKSAIPWRVDLPTDIVPTANNASPWLMWNFWGKILGPFCGCGIRRRLLGWGLSLFGIAFCVVVVAGYFYMVRQIRQDAAALQSELARSPLSNCTFVRRKIERFSECCALKFTCWGSKEQQLLLLGKNDTSFRGFHYQLGMEVGRYPTEKFIFPPI
jgi:hypothetical protein